MAIRRICLNKLLFQSLIHYILVDITTSTSNMNVNLHYLNILIVIVLVILLAIQFDWGLIGYFFCLTWRKKTVKFYSVIMTNWFWVEAVAVKRNLCHWTFLQVKIKITHISSSSEADSESDPHWQSILKKSKTNIFLQFYCM